MNKLNLKVNPSDPIIRKAIYVAYNGQCFYTGCKVTLEDMYIDHINPKANGGTDTLDNLVLCCGRINLAKKDKTIPPFAEVVTEIVKIIFLPKVLKVLEEMQLNFKITTSMTRLNSRMREKGISFRSHMWNKIRGRVTQRGKHKFPIIRHGKKIYYYISDIDPIIDQVQSEG